MSSFVDAIAGSLAWPAAVSSSTGAFHDGAATAAVVTVQVCIAASALPAVSLTAVDAEALWSMASENGTAMRVEVATALALPAGEVA